jgi:uncharacterized protein YndB with AHSA1/START domain
MSHKDEEGVMAPVVYTIEIDRPPEDVFAYATDLVRFGEWQNDVVRLERHGGGPLGLGSRFTTTRQLGGVEYKTTQEVTEFSPPSRFGAASISGPLRAIGTITIEPLAGGARSRFTSTLDFEGRGLGRLVPDGVRRMAAKRAPQSYQNLKELLERGTPTTGGRGAPGTGTTGAANSNAG